MTNAPPVHPAILFLGLYPVNMLTRVQNDTCARMLTEALPIKRGSEWPAFGVWMNGLRNIHQWGTTQVSKTARPLHVHGDWAPRGAVKRTTARCAARDTLHHVQNGTNAPLGRVGRSRQGASGTAAGLHGEGPGRDTGMGKNALRGPLLLSECY